MQRAEVASQAGCVGGIAGALEKVFPSAPPLISFVHISLEKSDNESLKSSLWAMFCYFGRWIKLSSLRNNAHATKSSQKCEKINCFLPLGEILCEALLCNC